MLEYVEAKSIFTSQADALVNPVNCVGIMGKGLAKEFKSRFPECFPPYLEACKKKLLIPGKLMFVQMCVQPDLFAITRPGIVLFPTKDHWKNKSKLEWIESGLEYLAKSYKEWRVSSIAMPQVGCGLGGLNWAEVKALIEQILGPLNLKVFVYIKSER